MHIALHCVYAFISDYSPPSRRPRTERGGEVSLIVRRSRESTRKKEGPTIGGPLQEIQWGPNVPHGGPNLSVAIQVPWMCLQLAAWGDPHLLSLCSVTYYIGGSDGPIHSIGTVGYMYTCKHPDRDHACTMVGCSREIDK